MTLGFDWWYVSVRDRAQTNERKILHMSDDSQNVEDEVEEQIRRIIEDQMQDWEEDQMDKEEKENNDVGYIDNENAYVKSLENQSDLKLLQSARIMKSFNDAGVLGLFRLFLTDTWIDAMRTWTNNSMAQKGLKKVNEKMFKAYIGLELAMSIIRINDIKNYWRSDMFCGQRDFQETMSRENFMNIRSNLVLRDPNQYDHEVASADPLWTCRALLEHFQKNISTIAVPTGTSALDEAGVRTKARYACC